MTKRLVGIAVAATLGILTLASIGMAKKGDDPTDGLSYQLTVTSVELPLGVWDHNGRFVTDLTKDDFEIREQGKKVPVDSFALVQMGSTPAGEAAVNGAQSEPERRRFLLFLDLLDSRPRSIQRIKAPLLAFQKEVLGQDDLMLVSALLPDRRMVFLQDFDGPFKLDRILQAIDGNATLESARVAQGQQLAKQLEELDQSAGNPRGPDNGLSQRLIKLDSASSSVRSFAVEAQARGVVALNALGTFADWFGQKQQEPGHNVLIYVSEGVEAQPAQDFVQRINQEVADFNQTAEAQAGDRSPMRAQRIENDYDLEPLFRVTAGRLARAGISLYAVDPQAGGVGGNPGEVPNSARDLSSGGQFLRNQASSNLLAEPTAGLTFSGVDDLSQVLRDVETDTRLRYFLTYRPPAHQRKRKAQFYKIEVHCKRPDVKVRHRQGYVD